MASILECTLADYHASRVKPRGFEELCDMVNWDTLGPGPQALWELKLTDRLSGDILKRIWTKNIVTDNGGLAMLKNTWNNANSTIPIMNQIAIVAQQGSTTLTSALAANTAGVTTLPVAALPAAIPSGTVLTLGYGGAAPQNVTTSALASSGATSITVTSFTVNSTGFAVGANVVPVPTTSDNPPTVGSISGAQYSGALAAGAFTFSGSGAGARQVVITYTFNGASYTAGNYTEAYTCNANPIIAGSTASHLITTPMSLNNTTNLTVSITERV